MLVGKAVASVFFGNIGNTKFLGYSNWAKGAGLINNKPFKPVLAIAATKQGLVKM